MDGIIFINDQSHTPKYFQIIDNISQAVENRGPRRGAHKVFSTFTTDCNIFYFCI